MGESVGPKYCARLADCQPCKLRSQCLRKETTKNRHLFISQSTGLSKHCEDMKTKIDLPGSREIYSRRMGIVEPVFANISFTKKLNRLNYHGQKKVDVQWKLFCIVHNIEKISKYGKEKVA